MKKILALLFIFLLPFFPSFAEETPPAGGDAGSLNLTSLPERKTVSSLADVLSANDADRIQKSVSDAIVSYAQKGSLSDKEWAEKRLREQMTGASQERITEIVNEITSTIDASEQEKQSLRQARQNGESQQSWLDGRVKKYITKAVEMTGSTPKVTSSGRNNGFSIAGKNWKGNSLSEKEAADMRGLLETDHDTGLKTAVAVGLILTADHGQVSIMNQAMPRQLAAISINAVEEAKTVLKVKEGAISGKEGVQRLTDTAITSAIGMLSGLDYKQIGFLAGTAAGTAAGGALEGATGGISLGTITINGALMGAYIGEKIGSRIGESLNATMDEKLKVRILDEFESFIGGTVTSVLNINDIEKALDSIEQQNDTKLTEQAANAIGKAKDGAADMGSRFWDTLKGWGTATGDFFSDMGTAILNGFDSLTKAILSAVT